MIGVTPPAVTAVLLAIGAGILLYTLMTQYGPMLRRPASRPFSAGVRRGAVRVRRAGLSGLVPDRPVRDRVRHGGAHGGGVRRGRPALQRLGQAPRRQHRRSRHPAFRWGAARSAFIAIGFIPTWQSPLFAFAF